MRYLDSIFATLLKPIDRRQFARIVAQHDGDAYDKSFKSWDHLVALVYAQFGKVESLRALEVGFNANSQHHYHLGTGKLARSTLAEPTRGVRLPSLRKPLRCSLRPRIGGPGKREPQWCA